MKIVTLCCPDLSLVIREPQNGSSGVAGLKMQKMALPEFSESSDVRHFQTNSLLSQLITCVAKLWHCGIHLVTSV
jgi:hypothetical protein